MERKILIAILGIGSAFLTIGAFTPKKSSVTNNTPYDTSTKIQGVAGFSDGVGLEPQNPTADANTSISGGGDDATSTLGIENRVTGMANSAASTSLEINNSANVSATNLPSAPVITKFGVERNKVSYKGGTNIFWASQNATNCTLEPVGLNGISAFQGIWGIGEDTVYTLTCTGAGGTTIKDITVYVEK